MDAPHSMLEAEADDDSAGTAATSEEKPASRILATLRHRWPEYVLEVLVIVFSISLSFALDAWRESKHRHELEQLYLKTLADNLEADANTLDEIIGDTEAVLASTRRLIALSQNPSSAVPGQFRADVGSMVQRPSFVAHDAAFANLRSSGNLEVIRDFDPKHQQFAVDPRCAPQRVLAAHPPDQRSHLGINPGTAADVAGLPAPVSAETASVPTDHGLGLDDDDRVQERWVQPIQPYQQQAIDVPQSHAPRGLAP